MLYIIKHIKSMLRHNSAAPLQLRFSVGAWQAGKPAVYSRMHGRIYGRMRTMPAPSIFSLFRRHRPHGINLPYAYSIYWPVGLFLSACYRPAASFSRADIRHCGVWMAGARPGIERGNRRSWRFADRFCRDVIRRIVDIGRSILGGKPEFCLG